MRAAVGQQIKLSRPSKCDAPGTWGKLAAGDLLQGLPIRIDKGGTQFQVMPRCGNGSFAGPFAGSPLCSSVRLASPRRLGPWGKASRRSPSAMR